MHSVVSAVAQGGLYVVAALAVVGWLFAPRSEKVALAVEIVVGAVAVAVLVKVAGALHSDPRPFVQDPSVHPWFSHSTDDGFPSDHTALAAMTSFVVLRRRRSVGLAMLLVTVLLGAARVVAHVHHVQDVVAGLVIGLMAAAVGALAWHIVHGSTLARRASGETAARETASQGSGTAP